MRVRVSSCIRILYSLPLIFLLGFITEAINPHITEKNTLMSLDLSQLVMDQGSGDVFKQVYFIALFFLSVTLFIKKRGFTNLKHLDKPTLMIVFVVIYIFSSVIWSDFKLLTIKRSIFQFILLVITYLSVLLIGDIDRVMKIIYKYFTFLALYIVAFVVIFPSYSFDVEGGMSAFYNGKNTLGFISFVGCLISIFYFNERQKHSGIILVIWAMILFLSLSKTCIAIMFILTFLNVTKKQKNNMFSTLIYLFLFFIFVSLIFYPVTVNSYYGEGLYYIYNDLFGSIDLTGRGEIWQISINEVNKNPLLGVGYAAFWGTGVVPDAFNVQYRFFQFINQSHNGYIDVLLQLGTVGLVLLNLFLFSLWNKTKILNNDFFSGLFLFCIIHNMTESSLVRDAHFVWCMLILISAVNYMSVRNNAIRKKVI